MPSGPRSVQRFPRAPVCISSHGIGMSAIPRDLERFARAPRTSGSIGRPAPIHQDVDKGIGLGYIPCRRVPYP